MAKEKKHTGTNKQVDQHAYAILAALQSIDSHLASLVYYQSESRGFGASIEKAGAQPYINESQSLQEEIKKLVIESLRELKKGE